MRQPAFPRCEDLQIHMDLIVRDIENSDASGAHSISDGNSGKNGDADSRRNEVNDSLARTDLDTVVQIETTLR